MRALAVALLLASGTAHAQLVHKFDAPAEEYARRWDAPGRDRWQKPKEVVKLLQIAPGMTVVDLGAGTGYFAPHLSRAAGTDGKVLALDVEKQLVEHMADRFKKTKLANTEARLVPYDDPKLDPASIDRVLTVDTWHHIDAREAYTKKLAAALKPGGFVAVVDFTLDSPEGPPREHRMAPEQVVKELEAGGLKAEIVAEKLPRQYVVIGRLPPPTP
jgi:predicted methyltransferase